MRETPATANPSLFGERIWETEGSWNSGEEGEVEGARGEEEGRRRRGPNAAELPVLEGGSLLHLQRKDLHERH